MICPDFKYHSSRPFLRRTSRYIISICLTIILIIAAVELIFRMFIGHGYWELPPSVMTIPIIVDSNADRIKAFKSINPTILLEDRYLFWKLSPNSQTTIHPPPRKDSRDSITSVTYNITINSLGFRSREINKVKNKGTFRIICLGDSATFGMFVNDNFTYPSQLEAMLNLRYPYLNFEVINAGVPGFSSFQERLVFKQVAEDLKPDLITLCFGVNDQVKAPRSDYEVYQTRLKWESGITFSLLHLKSFQCIRFHLIGFLLLRSGKKNLSEHKERVNSDEFFENYRQIVTEARSRGIAVIVIERNMLFPIPVSLENKVAQKLGVPFVPIQPVLKNVVDNIVAGEWYTELRDYYRPRYGEELAKNPFRYVIVDLTHPTAFGQSIIAEEVFKKLYSIQCFNNYISFVYP